MADVEIKGRISVDTGNATKSTNELIDNLKASKKALADAKIGSAEYKQAQENLAKSTKELDQAVSKSGGSFSKLKETLNSTVPGFQGASQGASGFGKQLWALVANPIGIVITAIVAAFTLLYNVFKSFDPVMDMIEQGFAAVKAVVSSLMDTVLALVTGTKSLKEAFTGLGGSIKQAATEAIEFTKVQQDLDDLMLKSTVNQSKYNRQINELILQSKDRTKTEAERVKLIDQALGIEEKAFQERKKIADEELKVAQGAIIQGRNLTKAQKKALLEKGVDYAISLKNTKGILDEEIKVLAGALAKQEDILNQSTTLREKALNRKYALQDAEVAKDAASAEKARAAQEKATAKKIADEAKAKAKADEAFKLSLKKIVDADLAMKQELADAENGGMQLLKDVDAEKERLYLIDKSRGELQAINLKAHADAEDELTKRTKENKIEAVEAVSSVLANASALLGESTVAGKAVAVASATISTYLSAQKAYESLIGTPYVGPIIAPIAAGVAVAGGIASVKKILSVKVPGGGGGSAPSMPSYSAPAPITPQRRSTNLDASAIQGIGNAAQGGTSRSFVLESDINNNAERAARINRAARLG